jgi:hypothetical protein
MGKNKRAGGRQQGAVGDPNHHGPKTNARITEMMTHPETGPRGMDAAPEPPRSPRYDPDEIAAHDTVGKDRLFEDRQQMDEADKNSEKTRRARDVERHGHASSDELTERSVRASAKRKS